MKNTQFYNLQQDTSDSSQVSTQLFFGLFFLTAVLVLGVCFLLWLVPYLGLTRIHPWLAYVWAGFLSLVVLFVWWSFLSLGLTLWTEANFPLGQNLRGVSLKLFLPVMIFLGRFFGIPKNKIRASFIKVNNQIVWKQNKKYLPQEVLILLPHCLQNSQCKYRLTYDIYNCRLCGKCPLADLIKLHKAAGVHLAIATGGTIARRIVVQIRPKLIIAVACERDLSSGIQDTYPLPVYGILNQRPHGPCLDTLVSIDLLKKGLEHFLVKNTA